MAQRGLPYEYEIEEGKSGLTALGGLPTYLDLASATGLLKSIDEHLRIRKGNRDGLFEYGENEFADNQGEDSDDYIRFTAKAPAGKPFTGRMWVGYLPPNGLNPAINYANQPQPITITSDYAEIIYFLRNGNLYRRVLLVAPQMQSAVSQTLNNQTSRWKQCVRLSSDSVRREPSRLPGNPNNPVSWQGVNDLSAHPSATGNTTTPIMLNTLGDLTNREKRFAYPRFANDFSTVSINGNTYGTPDGIPDDTNQDNVPDFYPSLYPNLFAGTATSPVLVFAPGYQMTAANGLMAFPYVFPGAYSKAQALNTDVYGWIHAPAPYAVDQAANNYQFDQQPWQYLHYLNHNPLDTGDNLPTPPNALQVGNQAFSDYQTWWGFPTWRETLAPTWNDPTVPLFPVSTLWPGGQPAGLSYAPLNLTKGFVNLADPNLLPPMAPPGGLALPVPFSTMRPSQQLFCDGFGQNSYFWGGRNVTLAGLWQLTWEDDLIMTGVRSFDVKAYDSALANYADLGWGDDLRLYAPYQNAPGALYPNLLTNPPVPPPALAGTPQLLAWPPVNSPTTTVYNTLNTFAHEGRMPPLIEDNRLDYQYPNPTYVNQTTYVPQYTIAPYNYPNYSSNVGDDTPGIVRLRRVWDTWLTDYSLAPATGVSSVVDRWLPARAAVLAAGLSVVSAPVPCAAPRPPDPDPRRRPEQPAGQVADDPAGLHGQVIVP